MEREEAKEILGLLAKGICPATGEILSSESPFNDAKVIRALYIAVEQLGAVTRTATRERDVPAQAGKSWSPEEDKQLLDAFDAGSTPRQLAGQHGRTRGAIESRLVKHGRLGPARTSGTMLN